MRFVILDVGQLSTSWISALRNWLARVKREAEEETKMGTQ
jgi:hypothetical protein